jgi:hypothetical protein
MQNLLNSESSLGDQAWPIWERHPGPWAEASSSLQMCEMRFDHIARNRHSDTSEGLHEEQMGILDSFPSGSRGPQRGAASTHHAHVQKVGKILLNCLQYHVP